MKPGGLVVVGAGVLGLGAILAAALAGGGSSSPGAAPPTDPNLRPPPPGGYPGTPRGPMIPRSEWIPTLLKATSKHEGTYWSVQANKDGVGVSWGILQWTQAGGGLATVLEAVARSVPGALEAAWGAAAGAVLSTVRAKSLAPVAWPGDATFPAGSYRLWAGPFLAGWQRLGRMPEVQEVQRQVAAQGEHMQGAIELARMFNLRTERALVVYFNRTVHQGVAGATGPARRLLAWYAEDPTRRPAAPLHVLAQYGWFCASRFRRTTAPDPVGEWVQVTGTEPELALLDTGRVQLVSDPITVPTWHLWKGGKSYFDLWNLIINRTGQILTDPGLRDQDCEL